MARRRVSVDPCNSADDFAKSTLHCEFERGDDEPNEPLLASPLLPKSPISQHTRGTMWQKPPNPEVHNFRCVQAWQNSFNSRLGGAPSSSARRPDLFGLGGSEKPYKIPEYTAGVKLI